MNIPSRCCASFIAFPAPAANISRWGHLTWSLGWATFPRVGALRQRVPYRNTGVTGVAASTFSTWQPQGRPRIGTLAGASHLRTDYVGLAPPSNSSWDCCRVDRIRSPAECHNALEDLGWIFRFVEVIGEEYIVIRKTQWRHLACPHIMRNVLPLYKGHAGLLRLYTWRNCDVDEPD